MFLVQAFTHALVIYILHLSTNLFVQKRRSSFLYYSLSVFILFSILCFLVHTLFDFPFLSRLPVYFCYTCFTLYIYLILLGKANVFFLYPIRFLIIFPASFFFSTTLLSFILLPFMFFFPRHVSAISSLISFLGFFFTYYIKKDLLTIDLTQRDVATEPKSPHNRFSPFPFLYKCSLPPKNQVLDRSDCCLDEEVNELRIVQLSDLKVGSNSNVKKLRDVVQKAVDYDPDLIVITGDIISPEFCKFPAVLSHVMEPLTKFSGKVFAVYGNTDHLYHGAVKHLYRSLGIVLLRDKEALVHTRAGPVQIIGSDFKILNSQSEIRRLVWKFPPVPRHFRLLLIHDGSICRHLPLAKMSSAVDRSEALKAAQKDFVEGVESKQPGDEGMAVDLILSGHTLGGQIGLIFSRYWDVLRVLINVPTRNLWRRGHNVMYVNRGLGVFGFPLRLFNFPEFSFLKVRFNSLKDEE
ncbi:hypothetical protein RCL1_000285 [Eukaryota sp. TZLM3-RCL]